MVRHWLLLILCACSDTPRPQSAPIIDSLDEPMTVTLDAVGKATLNGMLKFHDDDNAVTSMSFKLLTTNQETTAPIARASIGLVAITTVLSGTKNMKLDYEVRVVDETGLTSAPVMKSVLLQ